jgi:hypothetical protein
MKSSSSTRNETIRDFGFLAPTGFTSSLLSLLSFSTDPDGQDNARELHCTPHGEFRRPVEHRAGNRNQLRAQHELRKPVQHLDRDLAAVRYPMQQCGGGPMDVGHRHNALFILVTVTEMSASGTLADVSWPRAMWSFT